MIAAPPPPPTATPPNHSEIFEKFVNPSVDDDSVNVAGMVAYALYKKDKRQWMMRFCATNNREPRPDEIVNYLLGWNEARIDASRNMAHAVLQNFASFVLSQERPKIIKEALRGTFLSNLLTGIFVNASYTAILLLIVIVLGAQGVDLLELYEKLKPAR